MHMTEETTVSSASIDRFLSSLTARGRSENTITAYKSDLRLFLSWLPRTPTTSEDFEELAARWLNEHRSIWKPKTTNRRLTALRNYARWAKMETPDLDEYKGPVAARSLPHPIPEGLPGVIRMIHQGKNNRIKAMIALCGLAGLRLHEARTVRPADFDLKNDRITVRGKGDKERVVPLNRACKTYVIAALMDAVVLGRPTVVEYGDRFAREAITACGRRAGLARPVASHDLRATYLTAINAKTGNLRLVQEIAGHASSTTSEVYTLVTQDEMADASNAVLDGII